MFDRKLLKDKLKARLTTDHYEHSLRTADLAEEMARAYGLNSEKAYVAGLLHDYTKSMKRDEMLSKAQEFGFRVEDVETRNPYLIHARLAAKLVQEDLGIVDQDIIGAIEKHTFGAVSMSDLDKVIYIADMIEPGRPHEALNDLRRKAFDNLDEVFKEAYVLSVERLVKTRRLLHPQTLEVWNTLIAG